MDNIKDLFSNQYIISAIISWFFAQFLKVVIEIFKSENLKGKEFVLRALFGTGGMPSSHSATVGAVAVGIGLTEGFSSPMFAFAFVFLFVVMRDATGVRLAAGKQGKALKMLIENNDSLQIDDLPEIKEVKGHTLLESIVGLLIGIMVSLGIFLIQ